MTSEERQIPGQSSSSLKRKSLLHQQPSRPVYKILASLAIFRFYREMAQTKYWLMKSEPETYSIDDLKKEGSTLWTGIRNYQARNFMMKDMQVGDLVLFYHSNAEPPGIAGVAKISKLAVADPTQFEKKSDLFDPKATKEKPNWFCAQVQFVTKFKNFISLDQLRSEKSLSSMLVLKKGQRLSIQPVTSQEFEVVQKLGR